MNKRLKIALAALLGFSTACSSVKNTPVKGTAKEQKQEQEPEQIPDSIVRPRIVVMYGVPTPQDLKPLKPATPADSSANKKHLFPDVDPVVEKPVKN